MQNWKVLIPAMVLRKVLNLQRITCILYAERWSRTRRIFVSDGAKSDSANIQGIFSADCVVAVQDPAYPVYVDSNVIAGRTGQASVLAMMGWSTCLAQRRMVFSRTADQKVDLIYICSQ